MDARAGASLIASLLVASAFYFSRPAAAVQVDELPVDPGGNPFEGAFDMLQSKIDNISAEPVASLGDNNVKAFLHLIRVGEGTADAAGYARLFGGKQFQSFAVHPNIATPFGNTYSTAAGAY